VALARIHDDICQIIYIRSSGSYHETHITDIATCPLQDPDNASPQPADFAPYSAWFYRFPLHISQHSPFFNSPPPPARGLEFFPTVPFIDPSRDSPSLCTCHPTMVLSHAVSSSPVTFSRRPVLGPVPTPSFLVIIIAPFPLPFACGRRPSHPSPSHSHVFLWTRTSCYNVSASPGSTHLGSANPLLLPLFLISASLPHFFPSSPFLPSTYHCRGSLLLDPSTLDSSFFALSFFFDDASPTDLRPGC